MQLSQFFGNHSTNRCLFIGRLLYCTHHSSSIFSNDLRILRRIHLVYSGQNTIFTFIYTPFQYFSFVVFFFFTFN